MCISRQRLKRGRSDRDFTVISKPDVAFTVYSDVITATEVVAKVVVQKDIRFSGCGVQSIDSRTGYVA